MLLSDAFKALIPRNGTVLDVGSFDGSTAALFSELVGAEGKVYAFEPHPIHYLKLSTRAAHQAPRVIHPHCRAVSNYRGHASFFVSAAPDATQNQASTTVDALATSDRLGDDFVKLTVETCRLDDICTDYSLRPDFIKVDVEGAEDRVFQGAIKTLNWYSPYTIFECGWTQGTPIPQHIGVLEALGYELFAVDIMYSAGKWVSDPYPFLTKLSSADFESAPTFITNILGVPPLHKSTFPLRSRISPHQLVTTLKSL